MEIATEKVNESVDIICEGMSIASNMTKSTVEDNSEAETKNTSKGKWS